MISINYSSQSISKEVGRIPPPPPPTVVPTKDQQQTLRTLINSLHCRIEKIRKAPRIACLIAWKTGIKHSLSLCVNIRATWFMKCPSILLSSAGLTRSDVAVYPPCPFVIIQLGQIDLGGNWKSSDVLKILPLIANVFLCLVFQCVLVLWRE